MKRRLFRFVFLIFATITVTILVFWPLSFWTRTIYGPMQINLAGDRIFAKVWYDSGKIGGMLYWNTQYRTPGPLQRLLETGARQRWFVNNRAGFFLESRISRELGGLNWFSISLPAWFPLVLSAIFALLFRRAKQERSRQGRFCRNCGCDLGVSPDRCPECGTVPKAAPNAV